LPVAGSSFSTGERVMIQSSPLARATSSIPDSSRVDPRRKVDITSLMDAGVFAMLSPSPTTEVTTSRRTPGSCMAATIAVATSVSRVVGWSGVLWLDGVHPAALVGSTAELHFDDVLA